MSRFLKISVILLAWFIASARSCDDRKEDDAARELAQAHAARDSIASAFSSDTLSSATLRAFELTARYKLSDFTDYLQIFTDRSAEPAFRKKSGEMIRDLFISGEVCLRFSSPERPDEKEVSLEELLSSGSKNHYLDGRMAFDSIRVLKALHMENDTLCSGQLIFRPEHANQATSLKNICKAKDKVVDIFAVKRMKVFGNDSLKVWAVFLGNIR